MLSHSIRTSSFCRVYVQRCLALLQGPGKFLFTADTYALQIPCAQYFSSWPYDRKWKSQAVIFGSSSSLFDVWLTSDTNETPQIVFRSTLFLKPSVRFAMKPNIFWICSAGNIERLCVVISVSNLNRVNNYVWNIRRVICVFFTMDISCRDFHLILHGKCKSIYLKRITAKSSFLVILYLLSALVKDLLPAVTQLVPQTNFLSFCVILSKNWQ